MKRRFYLAAVSAATAATLLLSSCSFLFGVPVSSDTGSSDISSDYMSSHISTSVNEESSDTVTSNTVTSDTVTSDASSDTSFDISSTPESLPSSSENTSSFVSSDISSDISSVTSPDVSSDISSVTSPNVSSEASSEISSEPSSEVSSQPSSELSSESQPSSDTSSAVSSGGNDTPDIFTPITPSQYYYRSKLNTAERRLYDAVVSASDSYSASVIFPAPAERATVEKVLRFFFLDHPENFWWGRSFTLHGTSGRITRLTMKMLFSEDEIRRMQSEIDAEVEKIFRKIPSNASAFDMEELFHDHLVNTVEYTIPDNDPAGETMNYTLYGALVNKQGVCESYSEAFQYLCNLAGIPCFGISGQADGGNHKWNGVEIDGSWYITDVTWDDPTGSLFPKHSYFNVTSALISDSHVPDSELEAILPEFTATSDNYYAHHGLMCDLESLDEALKTSIGFFSEGTEQGSRFTVEIACPDSDTAQDCFDALSANNFNRMRDILYEYNRENGTNYSFPSYYDPNMCVLRFVLQVN